MGYNDAATPRFWLDIGNGAIFIRGPATLPITDDFRLYDAGNVPVVMPWLSGGY